MIAEEHLLWINGLHEHPGRACICTTNSGCGCEAVSGSLYCAYHKEQQDKEMRRDALNAEK